MAHAGDRDPRGVVEGRGLASSTPSPASRARVAAARRVDDVIAGESPPVELGSADMGPQDPYLSASWTVGANELASPGLRDAAPSSPATPARSDGGGHAARRSLHASLLSETDDGSVVAPVRLFQDGSDDEQRLGLEEGAAHGAEGGVDGDDDSGDSGEEPEAGCLCWDGIVAKETRRIWSITWPLAIGYSSSAVMGAIGLAFVGHLGQNELAAMSLGSTVMFAVYVFATGVLNAVNTLTAQAMGAKRLRLVGVWLQVGLVWPTLVMVPFVAASWWFGGDLLRLANVTSDDEIVSLINTYNRLSLIWLVPSFIYTTLTIWLEALEIVTAPTVISIVFMGLSYFANQILVDGALGFGGYGFKGAPLATSVCQIGQLVVLYLYIFWWKGYHKELRVWHGWTCDAFAFRKFKQLMVLGFPMACTEAIFDWAFEILTMFAGSLGTVAVAAMGVLVNLLFLLQPAIVGVYVAVSVRVGTALGENNPRTARRAYRIGMVITLLLLGGICAVFYPLARQAAEVYSGDMPVVDEVVRLTPQLCLDLILSAISYVLQGAIEGQGRPGLGTVASLIGNWGVGLSAAYIFGKVLDMKLPGLWWGIVAGEAVHLLILLGAAITTDWRRQAAIAVKLAAEEEEAFQKEVAAMSGVDSDAEAEALLPRV